MKIQFATTLQEESIKKLKQLALDNDCNVNDILEEIISTVDANGWVTGIYIGSLLNKKRGIKK
jgi:hypothetical protein